MKFTKEYLRDEIVRFREVMCSRRFTLAQKDSAFRGLGWVWLKADREIDEQSESWMEATIIEWERRRILEVLHGVRHGEE